MFGFGGGETIKESDTLEKNSLVYEIGDDKPFTGKVVKWHKNGQKEFEFNYKDGKLHGKETGWHKNGQKEYEVNYKDGKRHGKCSWWYENGKIKEEINYKDGVEIK